MNSVFEKIIEKLEELHERYINQYGAVGGNPMAFSVKECMEIVQEVAEEYNNGWIPCSERLPEDSGAYLTWVEYDGDRFIAIDEIDCDGIIKEWNCSTDYKVIAWQPLPQPYQPKGE